MNAVTFSRRNGGFTFVEMIVVIVIIGIVAGIVAVFIRAPILGYTESVDRAAVTDEADLALRRMARDLRLALPNSVRVTANGNAVEFLLSSTGGRYLSVDDDVAGLPFLDFDNAASTTFTAIGGTQRPIQAGNFIVVYNLGDGIAPSEAYNFPAGPANVNIAQVTAVAPGADNTSVVTLASNAFAQQAVPMPSPNRRFQVVTTPVTYLCTQLADGSLGLVRYWNYPISAVQYARPQGSSRQAMVAGHVASCNNVFQYGAAASRASALVILNLSLRTRDSGVVNLVHQVHVDNTP
ncbi:prepilin-type N-terminal cleavage/methylation domain-containing protein [Massilia sp. G4R7]|uniref:Prepilin-type N-terminal cleavage/methylation domain-containing protein n=1 Tax=Massilia phyllostachyos TaxID=2898585 RepID=A0ABS8Q6A9_9BURK|nr:prepilin-type N-terminal cleavage/methylation domain-containing protein [Massilia phyllostachyos]MCD2516496.1 prepilin-type N-terminal cleavage/methylation domain-containing protein [Massilia phyllostachyos]